MRYVLPVVFAISFSCSSNKSSSKDYYSDFQSLSGEFLVDNGTNNIINWESNDSTILITEYNQFNPTEKIVSYTITDNPLQLNLHKQATEQSDEFSLNYNFKEKKENQYIFEHPSRPYPRHILFELNNDSFDLIYKGDLMDNGKMVVENMEIVYNCKRMN